MTGVMRAEVLLDDHFASAEINGGVAARAGFASSFAGLAEGELDQLRTDFVSNVAVGDTVILHPTPTCGLCRACRAGNDMHCVNSTFPVWTGPTAGWPSTCSPPPGRA